MRQTEAERRAKKNAAQRLYYQRNREAVLAKKLAKDAENLAMVRERSRVSAVNRHRALKSQIFDRYGRKCVNCGYDSDVRALQIDHVHGGGTQHANKSTSKWMYMREILEDQTGRFQVLCANCNQIKRMELGQHRKSYTRNLPTGERTAPWE